MARPKYSMPIKLKLLLVAWLAAFGVAVAVVVTRSFFTQLFFYADLVIPLLGIVGIWRGSEAVRIIMIILCALSLGGALWFALMIRVEGFASLPGIGAFLAVVEPLYAIWCLTRRDTINWVRVRGQGLA